MEKGIEAHMSGLRAVFFHHAIYKQSSVQYGRRT